MPSIEFRLPSLGADMERATLSQWLKKPGDAVHRGEAIAVVETQKGLIDVECFDDGVLAEILVQPGSEVPVGALLARLTSASAAGKAPAAAQAPPQAATAPAAERQRISPAARRRAEELGVSLDALRAAGATAAIRIEDVEALAARAAPATPGAAADPRAAMRTAIGNAMARSKREIPHYYLQQAVDMSAARAWLSAYNAARPVAERLIEGVLIVRAVALAAAASEGFNGHFRDGKFEQAASVHVGTAIALRGGGLIAPALLDADRKDPAMLMREFSELVSRARAGRLRSSEFAAATLTLTSLGEEGVDALFPVINPPQVAIVGAGCVAMRPWEHEGQLVVRPIITLTLGADHRVSDGRSGSRFLRAIGTLLETPEKLCTEKGKQ